MNSAAPTPRRQIPQVPYTGPTMPTIYDPAWRKYTNLSRAQIDAFKAMPETCQQVARDLRHGQVLGVMPKISPDMTLEQVTAALDKAKTEATAPFAIEQTVLAEIGKTITTQDHVVKAFGA
jgi:hypothetical protein